MALDKHRKLAYSTYMDKKLQHRGHCQCCGRIQAVRGTMAHHGYEVKNGYFNGVCGGHQFAPIEVSREVADSVVVSVQLDIEKQLRFAEELKAGKRFPAEAKSGRRVKDPKRGWLIDEMVPYAQAPASEQHAAVNSAAWQCKSRADGGKSFLRWFEPLIERVHGQPLQVVELEDKPAPIEPGEQRLIHAGKTVATVRYVERGRVNWKLTKEDGRTFNGWTGVQAWRKLPLTAKE